MSVKQISIKIHNEKETVESHVINADKVSQSSKAYHIKARSDVSYELIEKNSGYAPENIATKRVGKDLHIAFEGNDINDPDLIIDGYYEESGELIVGLAENGQYYNYVPESAQLSDAVSGLSDGSFAGQALGGDSHLVPFWLGAPFPSSWLLGGLAALGGVVVAATGGGGDTNDAPATPTLTVDTPESINDANQNALQIKGTSNLPDGTIITITVADSEGRTVTSITTVAGGAYSITLDVSELANGSVIVEATASDAAGNPVSTTDNASKDVLVPTAISDTSTMTEDASSVSGNALINDTSRDGSETTAIIGTSTGTYGSIVLNSNGTYTYTRNTTDLNDITANVSDIFTYSVTDAAGNVTTSTIQINITPVNDAPERLQT